MTIETKQVVVENFTPITNGVLMQITNENELRSFNFESISGNTDDFTVTLQHVDGKKSRWVFDTVKSQILPNQARGDGKVLQGLSTVDDIRMTISGSEIATVVIHGGSGNTGKGTGEGAVNFNKGKFRNDQIAVPDGTVANNGWTVTGAENLDEAVDDLSDNSDEDKTYISATSEFQIVTFSLDPVIDPLIGIGHSIRITAKSIGSGLPETLDMLILENGIQRCNFPSIIIANSYGAIERICTNPEGNSIVDYTKLQVKLQPSTLGGGEEIRISKVEFLVPRDPNIQQFGEFTYDGTNNIIDVSLSKSVSIYTTNPHLEIGDLPINSTELDQIQININDFAPTNTSVRNVELLLSSIETYGVDSVRLDLIRDDMLLTDVTVADMLLRMDNDFYGIDNGLATASRVLADIYINEESVSAFYKTIIGITNNDTRNDVEETP